MVFLFILIPITKARPVVTTTSINDPALLKASRELPATGTLRVSGLDGDAYVYLKVSEEYESKLYSILVDSMNEQDRKCLIPDSNTVGEHITLFSHGSLDSEEVQSLPVGKQYSFQVVAINKVHITRYHHDEKDVTVWYTASVTSPQLNALYVRLLGQDTQHPPLHISLAVARFNKDGSCYYSPNKANHETAVEPA